MKNLTWGISGIYKIESYKKPYRFYIGSTCDMRRRWDRHIRDLNNKRHDNVKLQNHFNKYGISDLRFSILITCDKECLVEKEQLFLDIYKPWFNISTTAAIKGGSVECKQETRLKISKTEKDGYKNGRVTWNKGQKGMYSEETLMKMRISAKKKAILQYDLEMNLIKEWQSTNDAVRALSADERSIYRCFSGEKKQYRGFIWKRKEVA